MGSTKLLFRKARPAIIVAVKVKGIRGRTQLEGGEGDEVPELRWRKSKRDTSMEEAVMAMKTREFKVVLKILLLYSNLSTR